MSSQASRREAYIARACPPNSSPPEKVEQENGAIEAKLMA